MASISLLHFAGEETKAPRFRRCAQGRDFQKPSRPCAARGREHVQCGPSLPWGGLTVSHTARANAGNSLAWQLAGREQVASAQYLR